MSEKEETEKAILLNPDAVARQLIADGYYQMSRKFRMVARLPPGMTAVEACKLLAPDKEKIWRAHYERDCLDSALGAVRWSPEFRETCSAELDEATFTEFRKQGGGKP